MNEKSTKLQDPSSSPRITDSMQLNDKICESTDS